MSVNLPYPSCCKKCLVLFSALLFFTTTMMAQTTFTVTGKVIDNVTKEPLPGVTVRVKNNSNAGAITGINGAFTIKASAKDVIVFSMIGYVSQEQTVTGQEFPDVLLVAESKSLNEVVVIGYGTRQKRDLTSAISTIGAKDIERSTALTPELALEGQAAGVFVTSGGSDPTARPTIRIRGVSSFNDADPLYVIDGIPLVEGGAGTTVDKVNDPTRRGPINIYTIINPSDIESISVLKDASAAAVYGVRAANGVILITTKKGKKGQVKIDFDGETGTTRIIKTYKVLNTQQYTKYYTDMYNANPQISNGVPVPIGQSDFFGAFFDPASSQYIGNLPTYNWQDAMQNKNAMINNYNIRASGGTDNTLYSVSAGYSKNESPFKGTSSNRYSISSNISSKIGKYFETGLNLRLIQEKSTNASNILGGGSGTDLGNYVGAPFQPIYDPNGPDGYASLYTINTPLTPTNFDVTKKYGVQFTSNTNALGGLAENSNEFSNQSVIGTGYIQFQPITGLKIKGTYSGTQLAVSNSTFTGFDSWQFGQTPGNPYSAFVNPPIGSTPNQVGTSTFTTTNIVESLNVNYTHSYGLHNIDVLLDASQQNYKWAGFGENNLAKTSDLGPVNKATFENTGVGLLAKYALIGYLARVDYNYNSKYYLDAVIRRDGSSRFAPGHQWGTFPSGSAGWRISQEDFMKGISFINDLKIRGGYGVLGNEQTTGGWAYLSVAGVVTPSYNVGSPNIDNNGIAFVTFPNVDLTWEKLHQTNIGFDAVLFNNSIDLTVDYYHKVTSGIIQSVLLTPSSGIQTPTDQNIASVLNRGFEFSVGYHKTIGKVGISASANLTTVHNEVLSLSGGTALRGSGLEVGQPIGFIYGYKVGGIFQNQAQIDTYDLTHKDQLSTQQKPGDMYFQDLHGQPKPGSTAYNMTPDGVVDANDQTNIGNTVPKFYYGFNIGANYGGFDINAFFQGVGDVQKYDAAYAGGTTAGYGRNQFIDVLNDWTPEHPSTTMPRAVYNDPNANNRFSSRFVESAAYLRFQNLTVGYTLPKQLLEKTKMLSNLRVYATGINLFTVTKWKGLDPESNVDTAPATRQILFGLRTSF